MRRYLLGGIFFLALFLSQRENVLLAQTEYRLFGTATYSGGSIFSLNSTGTDLITHKVFSANGNGPVGSMVESDGYLYGMTSGGGSFNAGTIFSVKSDGTQFQLIHEFNSIQGSQPQNGLILAADGMLYGLTSRGGQFNNGVAFRVSKNGTGYQLIHEFLSSTGKTPVGKLMQASDGDFYGMTSEGGDPQRGTIFKIDHSAFSYTLLYEFDGTNGSEPHGGLVEGIDGNLYGMTFAGGTSGKGIIFHISITGSDFTIIHTFSGTDGAFPLADLVRDDTGDLFGMTSKGGSADKGVIFKISPDGSNHQLLRDLDGDPGGISPDGSMIWKDDFLYGVIKGADLPAAGTIFRLATNGTVLDSLYRVTNDSRYDLTGSLAMDSDGDLYGIKAPSGDLHADVGTIYKLDIQTLQLSTVHSFILTEGSIPVSRMVQGPDLRLYGTTVGGGAYGMGAIYSISSAGDDFQVVRSFQESEGKFAYGGLTPLANGFFAGTTAFGGASLNGAVYKIKYDGTGFTSLHNFQASEGSGLLGSLALGNDGKLYGLANGGSLGNGVVFRVGQDGSNFQVLHNMTGADGSTPRGGLIKASNGSFYGVTSAGGANTFGVIFKVSAAGVYSKLFDFDGVNGSVPYGDLIEAVDGKLYGMTSSSNGGAGVVYRINNDGTDFTIVHNFTPNEGGHPLGALTQAPTGEFYAMATAEGQYGTGYIFRLNQDGSGFQKLADLDFINGNPQSSLAVVPLLTQTITFDAIPAKKLDDPDFTLHATTATSLPITFYSSDVNIATIAGDALTIVGAGTATITARQKGNVYYATATATRELVVHKNDQTITFGTLAGKTFGAPPFQLAATASSALSVSYASDNESVATISGNTVTVKGTGTANITVTQAGNGEYNAAAPVTQPLTVGKGSQSITFPAISAKTLGGPDFAITGAATSGLPVAFSSPSARVVVISGTVRMIDAGKVTIKADQGGNSNYSAALTTDQIFCINPQKPGIGQTTDVGNIVLSSTNAAGYQWYFNAQIIPSATSREYSPTQVGRYTVQTTVDDCVSEMSDFIDIVFTGLNESVSNKISVYPNPVRDEVYLEVSNGNGGEAAVALMDVTGRIIERRTVPVNTAGRFDTSTLPRGMFFFRVHTQSHSSTHSFVRE